MRRARRLPAVPSLPLGITAPPPSIPPPPPGCPDASVGMTVLVLSADGTETTLPAIQQALDYHSVPYQTWIASQQPGQLVPTALADGRAGRFQGVILATGALSYTPDGGQTFLSALTPSEWVALRTYEAPAQLQPAVAITLASPVAVTVVVSGVCQTLGSDVYAGKCITSIDVPAGGTAMLGL